VGRIGTFFSHVGSKVEVPAAELLAHFILAVVAIVCIAGIELLQRYVGLDSKMILGPFTGRAS
jgi:hypothetical protein